MSSNKDSALIKYLSIAGALGLIYAGLAYLEKRKTSPRDTLPLDRTLRILQQIKYQVFTNCLSFAQGVNGKLLAKQPEKQLQAYLRGEMTKLYQQKEELIIGKYNASKQQYASALEQYNKDKEVAKHQSEIIDMMEKAVNGQTPDLTVPESALRLLNHDQIRQVYRQMCELIAVKVWEKLDSNLRNDPSFDSNDDAHFKRAIRQLSIYDVKIAFLEQQGFRKEWGCPNELFFKVMETAKRNNLLLKKLISIIEKAYEKLIENISQAPRELNPQKIHQIMDQTIAGSNRSQVVPVPQQVAPVAAIRPTQPLLSSVSARKPVAPQRKPKQQDEFDLQKLMMEELMKRSQQEPAEIKPAPVAIVVQEVKPDIAVVHTEAAPEVIDVQQVKPDIADIELVPTVIVEQQVKPEVAVVHIDVELKLQERIEEEQSDIVQSQEKKPAQQIQPREPVSSLPAVFSIEDVFTSPISDIEPYFAAIHDQPPRQTQAVPIIQITVAEEEEEDKLPANEELPPIVPEPPVEVHDPIEHQQ